jgi:hypothetical protein
MRETGFEPAQALSHESLNLAHLTTLALPQIFATLIKEQMSADEIFLGFHLSI